MCLHLLTAFCCFLKATRCLQFENTPVEAELPRTPLYISRQTIILRWQAVGTQLLLIPLDSLQMWCAKRPYRLPLTSICWRAALIWSVRANLLSIGASGINSGASNVHADLLKQAAGHVAAAAATGNILLLSQILQPEQLHYQPLLLFAVDSTCAVMCKK